MGQSPLLPWSGGLPSLFRKRVSYHSPLTYLLTTHSSGVANRPKLFVTQSQGLSRIVGALCGFTPSCFYVLLSVRLRAVPPAKTGDKAGIQAGNQIPQSGQGVVVLVEGHFGVGLIALRGGIPVEFGFGQQVLTGRSEYAEPARAESSIYGRNPGLNRV